MKLAAGINSMKQFADMPMTERIERIAGIGYTAIDFLYTKDLDVPTVSATLRKYGMVASTVAAGSLTEGLNDPQRYAEIESAVTAAAQDAERMQAMNVIVFSGNTLRRVPASAQNRAIIDGLRRLAPIAEKHHVTLIIEILNSLYDHPGYYLDSTELMFDLVRAVGHPRVKGLYDIYHAGIMRGNIVEDIRGGIDAIGHFHIAGSPGRNEPMQGELNYPFICRQIDAAGYQGYIGFEYRPTIDPLDSMKQTREWLLGA